MELSIDPIKWINPLQDYIAQLKSASLSKDPESLFKKLKNTGLSSEYTEEQINEMTKIKDYIDQKSNFPQLIECFMNILPLVIADHRKLLSLGKTTSADLISKLVTFAFRGTCNLWSIYEKCCHCVSDYLRDQSIYEKFLDKGIVDFVKLTQCFVYMLPTTAKLPFIMKQKEFENLAEILKSVENEAFYSCLSRKTKRLAEYWKGQVTRDLMNQNKAIPLPILQDRVKEARNTIELLHFFKIIVKISDESKFVSSANWRSKNIFQHYLFNEYIEIFEHFELLFMSLSVVAKTASGIDQKEIGEEYRLLVNSIFRSLVDTYDIVFDKLLEIFAQVMKKSKSTKVGTRGFLNTQNFGEFLMRCGHVHLIGNQPNVRDDTKNLRFFKILLFYSKGFREFIVKMADNLRGEDDLNSQIICILEQMIGEVEIFRERGIIENKEDEKTEKKNGVKSIVIKPERSLNKDENERIENKRKISDSGIVNSEITKYLQIKPTTDAILFSNEQDEESGYKMKRKTHKKVDDKTKSYLDYIKQYQYNDEYDDSLNFGTTEHVKKDKQVVLNLKVEEEDEDKEENEDELEDENLVYRSSGKISRSNNSRTRDENDNSNRGRGSRGGFNRRGRGQKRGRGTWQQDRQNKREYYKNKK